MKTQVEKALAGFKKATKALTLEFAELQSQIADKDAKIKELEKQLKENIRIRDAYNELVEVLNIKDSHYIEGLKFEEHVVWWMSIMRGQYELKIWQGDKIKCWHDRYQGEQKIYAEWNKYPDLIFVDAEHRKVVALECKFCKNGNFTLDKAKYEDYLRFQQGLSKFCKIEVQTYLMIGSGGEDSSRPKYMFCVPLSVFEHGRFIDLKINSQYRVMRREDNNTLTEYEEHIPF